MKKYFYLSNLTLSSFALILAYILEFMGFLPCRLCYYQRFFYVLIIVVSFLGYFRHRNFLILIHYLLLIGAMALSIFQVLVEEKLVTYKSSCTAGFESVESPLELLSEIYKKDLVPCDKVQIKIFELFSLAALNLFYLLVILCLNVILLYKRGSLIKKFLNYVTRKR